MEKKKFLSPRAERELLWASRRERLSVDEENGTYYFSMRLTESEVIDMLTDRPYDYFDVPSSSRLAEAIRAYLEEKGINLEALRTQKRAEEEKTKNNMNNKPEDNEGEFDF